MDLREWTKIFLRQRDLLKKEISRIKATSEGFTVTTKEGKERRVVVEEELSPRPASMIICLNTTKNIQHLIKHWQEYAKQEQLLIVFANPETNEKWLLKPYHHSRIADKKSLKQGIVAMHEAITKA